MDDQIFSDGLGQIVSVGGTVRLDLVAYSATEKDSKGAPLLVFQQRIILGTDNFLIAAEKIHEVAAAIAAQRGAPKNNIAEPRAATPQAPEIQAPVSPAASSAGQSGPKFP